MEKDKTNSETNNLIDENKIISAALKYIANEQYKKKEKSNLEIFSNLLNDLPFCSNNYKENDEKESVNLEQDNK